MLDELLDELDVLDELDELRLDDLSCLSEDLSVDSAFGVLFSVRSRLAPEHGRTTIEQSNRMIRVRIAFTSMGYRRKGSSRLPFRADELQARLLAQRQRNSIVRCAAGVIFFRASIRCAA